MEKEKRNGGLAIWSRVPFMEHVPVSRRWSLIMGYSYLGTPDLPPLPRLRLSDHLWLLLLLLGQLL